MDKFVLPIQVRWSDIDQNRHLRHSAYYDYGATARVTFFARHRLTNQMLEEFHIGPILFREEALFRKEIKFEDQITIDLEVTQSKHDFSRWSIRHNIYKQGDVLSAVLNLDGAWIDIVKRKLAVPNEFVAKVFESFPRSKEFKWMD